MPDATQTTTATTTTAAPTTEAPATKATAKRATAKKSTAKKATTKKATTKKTTAKKTTTKKSARQATAPRAATTTTAARGPRLHERNPQVLLEDVGYAAAGVAHDAIGLARTLPGRIEGLRGDVEQAAKDAPARVKALRTDVPSRVETTVKDARVRVSKDLQTWLDTFEQRLDGKAAEGRKVTETWRADDRVKRILEQTDNTRSQVKGAITSVVRSGTAVAETGRAEADTASSQVKGATTSARRSVETVADVVTEEDTTRQ